MKLQWARTAKADRNSIIDYIGADYPAAAVKLDARFEEVAARLIDFPYLGRPGRVPDTREFVAHKNYIVIYEIDGEIVRVLRVMHAARQWPPPVKPSGRRS